MTSSIVRFVRLLVTAEAAAWLVVAWLALDVFPGRLYRYLLPKPLAQNGNVTMHVLTTAQHKSRDVAAIVQRVGSIMPFRCVCFHRGVAAYWMLRRRGIPATVHYGVAHLPGQRKLRAHVWVSSGGRDVIGGADKEGFQEIARFQDRARQRSVTGSEA